MSELFVAGARIAFLVALWLLVLLIAAVIRRDLYGRSVVTGPAAEEAESSHRGHARRTPSVNRVPRALAVVAGRQRGLELPLGAPIDIGRAPGSTLVLDDDFASTRHATLRPDGEGGFYVEDFGSTNGTFINDHRISAPTALGLADTLRIGQTTMKLVS